MIDQHAKGQKETTDTKPQFELGDTTEDIERRRKDRVEREERERQEQEERERERLERKKIEGTEQTEETQIQIQNALSPDRRRGK